MFVNEDYYRLSKFITYINYSNVYRDESLHVHNQHILLSIVMYFYTCRRTYILDVYVEI